MESIHYPDPETGNRIKDARFYLNKAVCIFIQIGFLVYEFLQLRLEGASEYFSDFWNYLEVGGIIIFTIAALCDIAMDKLDDSITVLFVISILLCIIKLIYLVRVFSTFNFMVTMLT